VLIRTSLLHQTASMPLFKTSQDTFRENSLQADPKERRGATCVDILHNRYASTQGHNKGPYGRVWGALNKQKASACNLYQNHPSQSLSLPSQTPPSSVAVVKKSGVSNIATCRVLRSSKSRSMGDAHISKFKRRGATCHARIRMEDLG
jgi:hypothetical protein